MSVQNKRKYDPDFKRNAVLLSEEPGRTVPEVAENLGINSDLIYRWCTVPLSKRKVRNEKLRRRIKNLFFEHKGMVGSPIITADIREDSEFSNVRRPRVARHMKDMGLKCKTVKKFVATTDSKHNEPVAPNLLDRQITVPTPDTVYVGDITCIEIGKNGIISWFLSICFLEWLLAGISVLLLKGTQRYKLSIKKAILRRRPGKGSMVHSDRGVQYASSDFRAALQKNGFIQSMSRKGNCWDNAEAESFFHSIKTQMIHHRKFQNVVEVEQALFNYIEIYYNRRRKHSTNGYKAPAQYEMEWWNNKKAA